MSSYTWSNLLRRPSAKTVVSEFGSGLKRELTISDLIGYGISSTIGAGIFVTIGFVAKQEAGPGIVLSFIFAGFASLLSALCYSEFASRFPVSGSAYTFASLSLGEAVGWFVGWNLTLEYAISASAVARGWSSYLLSALTTCGLDVPDWLNGIPLTAFFTFSPLSGVICVLCTLFLLVGMKESARFNLFMTILNVLIILFIIFYGATFVKTENWKPFLPFGMNGAWSGVGTVFFSYIGFDSVSTLAGEVKKPARDLPIGIVGTLLIVSVLYIAVALVATGMVYYSDLNVNAPLSAAFVAVHSSWASIIVSVGSVTVMTVNTLASLVGQPRIFLQMAKDGLIFKIFGKVNPKTGVAVEGTIITGLASTAIALFFDLDALVNMISIGTLLAFTVVCAGVVILRYASPENPKKSPLLMVAFVGTCFIAASAERFWPFSDDLYWIWVVFTLPAIGVFALLLLQKQTNLQGAFLCPLVPFIPCLGIFLNVWFIMHLPVDSLLRLLVWTIIGTSIYLLYGIRHSKNLQWQENEEDDNAPLLNESRIN